MMTAALVCDAEVPTELQRDFANYFLETFFLMRK